MDESGDLGFDFTKQKTSAYFIITFLLLIHKRPAEKIIKHFFRKLSLKKRKSKKGCLHSHKENHQTRIDILSELLNKELKIISIILDKKISIILDKKISHKNSYRKKHSLYNIVTVELLNKAYDKKLIDRERKVNLIASRRETNKYLNEGFKILVENLNITVEIKTPSEEKCLQLVDFVSWAIFRKYEFGDNRYYELIKNIIAEEIKFTL